jgi:hypothetical protein
VWIVWWGATHLGLGYPDIFNANTYYPHPSGLLYSEPMFSQALMGWPLFHVLDNPILAINVLTLLTLALSAFGAHLLLRELTGSDAAAAVGAVFYAFNSYNFSQLPRLQLISLQWMPLALLSLHRFFARERNSYLFGFAAFSILLGLACFYYLMFYVLALAFILPLYLWAYQSWRKPGSIALLGGSGILIGATLGLVALPYLALYRRYGFVGHPESFDLAAFFRPPSDSLLYAALGARPHLVDQFLGYFALLLGALGLVTFFRAKARGRLKAIGLAYLLVGVMGFFLSAGPQLLVNGARLGPGPYRILQNISPYGNMRDPYRFSILTRLALSLFVAQAAASLFAGSRPAKRAWGCALLAGLVVAEQWSPRRVRGVEIPTREEIPEAYPWLVAHRSDDVLAELPVYPSHLIRFTTLEAYFSTFHQRRILFNKPSFYPPALELLQWELRNFPDQRSVTLLQALKVRLAVVHPKRWGDPGRRKRSLRSLRRKAADLPLVRKFPDRDDSLWDQYDLGGERIHLITPLSQEGSPRSCACREIDRDSFELVASGTSDPGLAIDGDRETKWTTGGSQGKGDFFEITFDRTRRPARIEIEMAFPYGEFVRNLGVNGYRGERGWRMEQLEDVWYTVALVRQLIEDPSRARLRYDLLPIDATRIRLFIRRTEPGIRGWSIPEIHVYEFLDEGGRWDE